MSSFLGVFVVLHMARVCLENSAFQVCGSMVLKLQEHYAHKTGNGKQHPVLRKMWKSLRSQATTRTRISLSLVVLFCFAVVATFAEKATRTGFAFYWIHGLLYIPVIAFWAPGILGSMDVLLTSIQVTFR